MTHSEPLKRIGGRVGGWVSGLQAGQRSGFRVSGFNFASSMTDIVHLFACFHCSFSAVPGARVPGGRARQTPAKHRPKDLKVITFQSRRSDFLNSPALYKTKVGGFASFEDENRLGAVGEQAIHI